jgi:molybdenum cofactor cytidylyltransferase
MSVQGVLLAAGFSSRMGCNKLILELNGRTVLERCLDSMSRVCSRIFVVGGHRARELEPLIKHYPQSQLILNQAYSEGMFSSVLCGIKQVYEDRFFLCPADYPLIPQETYQQLLQVDGEIIIPTFNGRRGHPVLMESRVISDILNGNYASLKHFISLRDPKYAEVSDPGILIDIDTREAYENIKSILSHQNGGKEVNYD